MGENNNWDNFKYPPGCLLEDQPKAALIMAANSGIYHPFRICELGQSGKCPREIETKCFDEGVGIILAGKLKPK